MLFDSDSRHGPEKKKKNGIGERCTPTVMKVTVNDIAARDDEKYERKLSVKSMSPQKDPKANPVHTVKNEQIGDHPD